MNPSYEDWWRGLPGAVQAQAEAAGRETFERAARLRGHERDVAFSELIEAVAPVLVEHGRELERAA